MKKKAARKTVLVVDDDADLRQQMAGALEAKYRVLTAASGAGCLEVLAAEKPDCIVMDVMMDDVADGLETARTVRGTPATAGIPIILLTSVNKSYDYRAQAPMDYYPHDKWLDKPVKGADLLAEVSALVD